MIIKKSTYIIIFFFCMEGFLFSAGATPLKKCPNAPDKVEIVDGSTMSKSAIDVGNVEKKTYILISNASNATLKFAAEELQKYIKKMSNVTIEITHSVHSDARHISIGNTTAYKTSNLSLEKRFENDDQFIIAPEGEMLFLYGLTDRANLYAVYHLLEFWGCRWYAPTFSFNKNLSEFVPQKQILIFPDNTDIEKPSFQLRGGLCVPGAWSESRYKNDDIIAIIDWMAKQKLNVVGINITKFQLLPLEIKKEIHKRALLLMAEGHCWEYFLKNQLKNINNICASSKSPESFVARQVARFLVDSGEIDILGPWGDDNSVWRICPAKNIIDDSWEYAGRFYSSLKSEMIDQNNPAILTAIAYQSFLFPMKHIKLPSRTLIYICPIDRDYTASLWDEKNRQNVKYAKAVKAWSGEGFNDALLLYSYYRKHCWHSLPVFTPDLITEEMGWAGENGFIGATTYFMVKDWLAYDLQHLTVAMCCWDPAMDVEAKLKDYLTEYLGDWELFYGLSRKIGELSRNLHGGGYYGYSIGGLAENSGSKLSDAISTLTDLNEALMKIKKELKEDYSKHTLLVSRMFWVEHWKEKLLLSFQYKKNRRISEKEYTQFFELIENMSSIGLSDSDLIDMKEIIIKRDRL